MKMNWSKRLCGYSLVLVPFGTLAAPLDLSDSPLTVSTTTSPNVMLLLDNSGSMASMAGGGITRLQTVKNVAKEVIEENPGMNYGLTILGSWQNGNLRSSNIGGTVIEACKDRSAENPDSSTASYSGSIYQSIDGLTASTWTPLAEALYEVTRYYRGLSTSYSNTSFPGPSPIQYRCQQNFAIVLTDGFPTYDANIPTGDPDAAATPGKNLPNWDANVPNAASDGRQSISDQNVAGEFRFLDDIALFAHDIDFRKTGNDAANKSFNDPEFPIQNMVTYTVGFTVNDPMLGDAARYGDGVYYLANNAATLKQQLSAALTNIADRSGSSSSAAANTGRLRAGSNVYQARFNSTDWSGQLLAFAVDSDKTSATYGQVLTNGPADGGSLWDAGEKVPAWSSRKIFTNDTNGVSGGQRFRWDKFSAQEKTDYFNGQQLLLQYIRGRNDATTSGANYRVRGDLDKSPLGDIVHSTPYYVGKPAALYQDSLEAKPYSAFASTYKSRTPIIYVGGNDGMLHGFDAQTGVEKIAFIPNSVLPNLKKLSEDSYSHLFYVDGSPTVVDAYLNNDWRTVLLGGLNAGGQGIYALDITDPGFFSETDANAQKLFMWEFTDKDDIDLGYTYSRPKVVKLNDGKWYAVFGNGYNSTVNDGNKSLTGDAVVFIVSLEDKTKYYKLSTEVGFAEDTPRSRPNGFGSVTTVDVDGDQVTDYIYGGDLFGNVWKFSLKDADPAQWGLAYKLFEAKDSTGGPQPITSSITVGRSESGNGQMVYFGTGKYLETNDNNGAAGGVQSFYAIHDRNSYTVSGSNPVVAGRSALLEQTITKEQIFNVPVDVNNTPNDTSDDVSVVKELRETSSNTPTLSSQGWFIDLKHGSTATGERIISSPALRGGQILFVTNIPSSDPCSPGGESWVMKLDAYSGKRLNHTYDVNEDGRFDGADKQYNGGNHASTGIKVNSGNSPSFMPDGDADKILISTNTGIKVLDSYLGQQVNRQSWQQIN